MKKTYTSGKGRFIRVIFADNGIAGVVLPAIAQSRV